MEYTRKLMSLIVCLALSSSLTAETPQTRPSFDRGVFSVLADTAVNGRVHDLLVEQHRVAPWVVPSDVVLFNVYVQVEPNSGIPILPTAQNIQLLAVGVNGATAELQHVFQGSFTPSVTPHDKGKSLRVAVSVQNGIVTFNHQQLDLAERMDVLVRRNFDTLLLDPEPKAGHQSVMLAMDPSVRIAPRLNPTGLPSIPPPPLNYQDQMGLGPVFTEAILNELIGKFGPVQFGSPSAGGGTGAGDGASGNGAVANPPANAYPRVTGRTPRVYVDDGADGVYDYTNEIPIESASPSGSLTNDPNDRRQQN